MSLIRKHGAVLQAWACLDLVFVINLHSIVGLQLQAIIIDRFTAMNGIFGPKCAILNKLQRFDI